MNASPDTRHPPRRTRRWLIGLGAAALLAYACDRATLCMWDGWTWVRVVGSVVNQAGEPVGGADLTLVVDPNHQRFHVWIDEVGRTNESASPGLPLIEDERAIRLPCPQAAVARTGRDGRFDVVLRVRRGGTSSLLLERPGPRPAFGGIHMLLVESDGFAPRYICGDVRAWSFEDVDAGPYQVGANLDVGRIVLQPLQDRSD